MISPSDAAPLHITARPFTFRLDPGRAVLVIIDMQRDFIEPGGFGASLGNDVSHLAVAVAPTAQLLALWRERGWPVVHTRESHAPDLSDCPPAKRHRGSPRLRIGDPGPMGRLLVEEATASLFPAFKAATIEMIVAQGGIVGWSTRLADVLAATRG
jgi:biuret amidohydrolase